MATSHSRPPSPPNFDFITDYYTTQAFSRCRYLNTKDDGWYWKQRYVTLTQDVLRLQSSASAQRKHIDVPLSTITNLERIASKDRAIVITYRDPYSCRTKSVYLQFESDDELYGWMDDIHKRSPLGCGTPSKVIHHVHVEHDQQYGFKGLPPQWRAIQSRSPGTLMVTRSPPTRLQDLIPQRSPSAPLSPLHEHNPPFARTQSYSVANHALRGARSEFGHRRGLSTSSSGSDSSSQKLEPNRYADSYYFSSDSKPPQLTRTGDSWPSPKFSIGDSIEEEKKHAHWLWESKKAETNSENHGNGVGTVLLQGDFKVNEGSTWVGWMWPVRHMVLTSTLLVVAKEKKDVERPQKSTLKIHLNAITAVSRVDAKPYCLSLEFGAKKKLLIAFDADKPLYEWQEAIYSNVPVSGVSDPKNFAHELHVGLNPQTGKYTGLPDQWKRSLQDTNMEYLIDTQAKAAHRRGLERSPQPNVDKPLPNPWVLHDNYEQRDPRDPRKRRIQSRMDVPPSFSSMASTVVG